MICEFEHEIDIDVTATVQVLTYSAGSHMGVTGWGFGDSNPGEPPEVDFMVYVNGERYLPNTREEQEIKGHIHDLMEQAE